MNKKQAERWRDLEEALATHGVTQEELNTLLRCERALRRWAERECGDGSNWAVERDETTGKPFNVYHGPGESRRYLIEDLEGSALRRVAKIVRAHGLEAYHQGDPRGCTLYVLRPGDVPAGEDVAGYYTRGIAVCID